jgi:hypothetical protein
MTKWILYFCCGLAAGYILAAPLEDRAVSPLQSAAITRKLRLHAESSSGKPLGNCTLQTVETADLAGLVSHQKIRLCR